MHRRIAFSRGFECDVQDKAEVKSLWLTRIWDIILGLMFGVNACAHETAVKLIASGGYVSGTEASTEYYNQNEGRVRRRAGVDFPGSVEVLRTIW